MTSTNVRPHPARGQLRPVRRYRTPSLLLVLTLGACDLAPAYHPPALVLPAAWKENSLMRDASPNEGALRGDWWAMYGDAQLNSLEAEAARANPDIAAAAEAFIQSRDAVQEAASQLFPQLNGTAGGEQNKSSRHRLYRVNSASNSPIYMSSEQYYATATWEPDFWSSIRNKVRMNKQQAQKAAADYALARLSIQADLADDYMTLRGLDAQHSVYQDSIRYYEMAVQITQMRQAGAIAAGLDVARAQTQLFSTRAADTDIMAQRALLEHAIAVLVNKAPASFHLDPAPSLNLAAFTIPAQVPSTLLERRPDIAAAEREMAQANRSIGISRAAFYPHVTFNAMTGFMDNGFDLASLSNSMYSFGVSALMPLFTGGLRRADLQRSWSRYRQSEDKYRATVLDAFKEVEDGLVLRGKLSMEASQQAQAVAAAIRTQRMTMALYTGGLTNYLDVVTAQIAALSSQIAEVQVRTRELQASVQLIRALGGGWSSADIPAADKLKPFGVLQYEGLRKPAPAGGVDSNTDPVVNNLTTPVSESPTGDLTGKPSGR